MSGIFCFGVCFFLPRGGKVVQFFLVLERSSHTINPWTHIRLALTCNCVASCSAGNRTVPVPWFPPLFFSLQNLMTQSRIWRNCVIRKTGKTPSWALQCMKLIFSEWKATKTLNTPTKINCKRNSSKLDFPSHEKGDGGPNSKIADRSKWFGRFKWSSQEVGFPNIRESMAGCFPRNEK